MNFFGQVFGAYRRAFSGLPRLVWILAGGALVNRAGTMVLLHAVENRNHLRVAGVGAVLVCIGLSGLVLFAGYFGLAPRISDEKR